MAGFFAFLFLLSLIAFVAGTIYPRIFAKIVTLSRKTTALFFGSLTILFFILTGATATPTTAVKGASISLPPTQSPSPTTQPSLTPTAPLTPTLTPTPTPHIVPTHTSVPTAVPTQSGLSNDNYYQNSDGNTVHSPAYSPDNSVPAGATARCADGTYSFSQHRSGTCSHHGGVAEWL